MNKQIIVIAGLIVALGAGYYLGQNQTGKGTADFTLLPKFSSIKDWRTGLSGDVVSITSEKITVSSDNQSISLALSPETKVEKIIIAGGKLTDTVKNLSLSDVKVGVKIFVSVKADLQGALQTDIITLLQEIK